MSDVQKPVEETPIAAPAVAPVTEAPAAETTATETPAVEAPNETAAENAEAAPAAAEDKKDEAATEQPKEDAKEVTPASEGVLGHKAPGLVKGLRFSKRFFYFSDDAVEARQLSAFHQNEKPAVAHPIAAWASQTGKGLLFFTKRAEDKNTPTGIFNLADVTDVTKEGSSEFLFKVNGHKHTFQAASATERDSWVVAIEAKAAEAKAEKETITSGEGYKAELEKLTKPVVAEPAKKPAEAKEEPKEEAAPAEENKDTKAKSRSQSRKRASIFGSLLGKKEEAEEKKEAEKTEESKPAEATTEATAEASAPAETAETPVAPVEPVEPVEKKDNEEKDEVKEEKKEEKKAETKSKRASLFGNFFQKVTSPSHEKTEKEASAPAETSAVASTAPQLDNPVEEAAVKPIEPESVTAPAEAEAAKDVAPASPAAETPKDKRRTSFFGNFGKKKGDSDNEAEGESKPKGNKLGGLFRKPSKAVKSETKDSSATEAEAKAEGAPKEATLPESAEESKLAEAAPAAEEAKPAAVSSAAAPVQAAA
ncbi:Pleckstrin homology domain-containing protein [Aspergillus leporis]|uniref:Pleckstrin homology domain-containing protein n=1 Tax=Aspergillus leporis TaxID=41062 RepID=A0A5N5XG95_9EURO|nr:Pleckstrin homology domain-containing protein [Aspergillus leporis]